MTDEEIEQLMNSTLLSDEESEYEDDDNSIVDPDYVVDQISPEEDQIIDDVLCEMNNSVVDNEVGLSLNFSTLSGVSSEAVERIPYTSITSTDAEAATTTKKANKPRRRPHSPLPTTESTGPQVIPSSGGFTGSSVDAIDKSSIEFSNILWRQRSMKMHVNEIAFRGDSGLPYAVRKLKNPIEFLNYFLTDELIVVIVEETNRAAWSIDINTQFITNSSQIRKYLGVLMFMSIFRYPNIDAHWSEFGFRHLPNALPWKKFFQ
ncbi:uncharacterized protein LOC125777160 [Bactrocera dorsalis]|uniref:Uncharacterized protein LOC125777160 n=1 Tax=Bactrocera dorsalis TaxID=27457 RepID=A0ABM3JDR7_BACDO|nr:uncharacterized protein LOC125777160 [Bactrocera dorsalis]